MCIYNNATLCTHLKKKGEDHTMKNLVRLVSYVSPREKAFIEELSAVAQLSQSALIVHAIEQMQIKYKYLHSLPLKDRLIKIIKSYNLYAGDNGEAGIKIGDINFQQKLSLPKDLTVDGIARWLTVIHDSF